MAEFEAKCQTTIYFNKGNTTETSKPVMMKDTTNERLGGNVVVFGNPKKTRFVVGTKDKLLIDQVFKDEETAINTALTSEYDATSIIP